jgi:hypothetical protein
MATSTFCFVLLGVTALSANLMKIVLWLDAPQPRRRSRRAMAR